MVKRGVEYLHGFLIRGLYLDSRKFFIPCFVSSSDCCIKVPSRKFSKQIGIGSFHAYRGKSDLHHDLLPCSGRELRTRIDRHISGLVRPYLEIVTKYSQGIEWLRELSMEIYLLVVGPSARETVTSHRHGIHDFDMCIHGPVPASSVQQVNYDSGLIRLRKSITVHADACSRCKFHVDSIAEQRYAVIARACHFPAAVRI